MCHGGVKTLIYHYKYAVMHLYDIISVLIFFGGQVVTENIDFSNISPELVLCHKSGDETGKRIYHPERKCIYYGIVLIQDKPDIQIVNGKEYFAYPEDIIFHKPGDTVSSYSYGTNCTLIFSIGKSENGRVPACDFMDGFKTQYIIKNSVKCDCIRIITELSACFESSDPGDMARSKLLLLYIIELLCDENDLSDPVIEKSKEYINKNIRSKLLIDDLTADAGLSRTHFHRLFKQSCGMTPIEYVNKMKMKLAREWLINSGMKISEISGSLGFESVMYFRRLFKHTYGISPTQYTENFCQNKRAK